MNQFEAKDAKIELGSGYVMISSVYVWFDPSLHIRHWKNKEQIIQSTPNELISHNNHVLNLLAYQE